MNETAIRAGDDPGLRTGEACPLSKDILRGAEAIAEFVYGHRRHRRKVYHLIEHSRLPVFRLGATICARRSTLLLWVADQEQQSIAATED